MRTGKLAYKASSAIALLMLMITALGVSPTATAVEVCEPSLFGVGEVCANAHGFVNSSPTSNCSSGGSGDCVRFHTAWSGSATLEGVIAIMYDIHATGLRCQSALPVGLTTGFCSDTYTTWRWHDDINDVCNEIEVQATGQITGVEALATFDAGNGC